MRTVDDHEREIRALVEAALTDLPSEGLVVDPARFAADPAAYRARRVAGDVVAPIDLPPFANSQMDGYAVASADAQAGGASLVVAARIPAGRAAPPLDRGHAAPIMTGAPIPPGADAVVPIERVVPDVFPAEGTDAVVTIPEPVVPGTFVRAAGSDVAAGTVLVESGTRLTAAHWGVLAAAGLTQVDVVRRPRLLVVSTGEELSAPGAVLEPGRIHDANGIALTAGLVDVGVDVVVERVSDDAAALLAAVSRHAGDVDLVVTTGGVSAGAYEVVRDAFDGAGVVFGAVAMQPGGPQGWGTVTVGGYRLPVVCFPGNPVSTLVSFEAFLRPVLQRVTGAGVPRRRFVARMAEAADSPGGKHQLRRGELDTDGRARLIGGPGSHLLTAHAAASVLVHVPVGVSRVDAGDEVVVWSLHD